MPAAWTVLAAIGNHKLGILMSLQNMLDAGLIEL